MTETGVLAAPEKQHALWPYAIGLVLLAAISMLIGKYRLRQ